jgi:hypothetical protein
MRPIRTVMTTLLVTGLASLGYARPPAPVAAQPFSALSLGLAVGLAPQQDGQKPKETPDSKPSNAAEQEKPDKQQKPDKAQTRDAGKQEKPAKQKDLDKSQTLDAGEQEKPAKHQQPDQFQKQEDASQKQDKNLAQQEQREDKGHVGNGGRIPDKDFKAHFGQEHKFSARQVVTTTTIVPNQTRFVYTGYTFVFADPWPAGWAMDDDCYIDYTDGGYYLLDMDHPGVQIALTIVG